MRSWVKSFILITGMLVTGTINTLTKKIQFEAVAPGYFNHSANDTKTPHHFNKPWFQTWIMFLGEILCLFVYLIVRYREKRRIVADSLFGDVDFNPEANPDVPKYLGNKIFAFVFAIPSTIDMTSSTLQGIGLLYVDASVWQMMRGSLIIFTGLLSIVFLKRKLRCFHWIGILFNVAGLCLVGISSVFKSNSGPSGNYLYTLLGVFLVLLGAFGTATQVIVEEKLLKGKNYHALHAVGMEGVFGFLITGCIALPITHFIRGNDLNGSYENFVDAIYMTFQSGIIFSMVLLNILSIAFFNYFGLSLTKHLTAVHRTLIDTVRTVFVWLSGLILYYASGGKYGEEFDKQYGLLQIDGFLLLIIGTFIYNKLLKLDWIRGCEQIMSTDDAVVEEDVDVTISVRDESEEVNSTFRRAPSERTPLLRSD